MLTEMYIGIVVLSFFVGVLLGGFWAHRTTLKACLADTKRRINQGELSVK